MKSIVWFRRDLRINDNPALCSALKEGMHVIALFIYTPSTWSSHDMGDVQISWLNENLSVLEKDLKSLNIPLVKLKTNYYSECPKLLAKLCAELGVKNLYLNNEYEVNEKKRDALVKKSLGDIGCEVYAYDEQCLIAPDLIKSKEGEPYKVFTPFYKRAEKYLLDKEDDLRPLGMPKKQETIEVSLKNDSFKPSTPGKDISWLKPGTIAALDALENFISEKVQQYDEKRDFPSINCTSKLSPYLSIGVISVRMCVQRLLESYESLAKMQCNNGEKTWFTELIWRDFYKMICFNFPKVCMHEPFIDKTRAITWNDDQDLFNAWCEGRTGVPIVDAAMRQLNTIGWMHNRLRMIVAMFLSKNLWLDWRWGESYFAKNLVDWDFAANNGGWQWSASTGTDSVPYFRIFNPISQSQKFDEDGDFIRKYLPELAKLDNKEIHEPSIESRKRLNYPEPIVDIKKSRKDAITAFKVLYCK